VPTSACLAHSILPARLTQRACPAVGRPVSAGLVASFVSALSALCLVLAASPATAGIFGSCEHRPGTPTNLAAKIIGNSISLTFINTAHTGGTMFWDVEVRDGAGNPVGRDRSGSDATPSNRGGSVAINFTVPPLQPNVYYCFRVRARDAAGTQGCTSEIWGNQACITAPDPEMANFCTKYADDARAQSGTLEDRQLKGPCAAAGPRWLASWQEHFDWCMAMRKDPQLAKYPDIERNARWDTLSNCQGAPAKHIPNAPTHGLPLTTPAPDNQCKYTVFVTNDECINGDGSPMTSNPTGALQTYGCGASEDEALERAKAAFYQAQGPQLSDDDPPCPGCCTYTKSVAKGCACPSGNAFQSLKVQKPCLRGMVSVAGGCGCPAGTQWRGLRCRRILPGSPPLPNPPPASAPARVPPPPIAESGSPGNGGFNGTKLNTGTFCMNPRPVGTWPNCCPRGTHFDGRVCRRSSPPGPGPGNGSKPVGPVGHCPRSRPVGTPPNCCPQGTVYMGHLCRRLHGPGSGTNGNGGTNGTKSCPPGTHATHFGRCRKNASPTPTPAPAPAPAPTGPTPHHTCPTGHIGQWPNCYCPSGMKGPTCSTPDVR
jgi:hypothetical protein